MAYGVTSYLVKHDSGCFSEGGFGWDLYLNWYTLRKQIAFYNVGGPRAISWRSEKNEKLTSLEQERICQQTALELELQHRLLPGSPAWPPLDLSCNFPVAANFSGLPAFFIKFWTHQTSTIIWANSLKFKSLFIYIHILWFCFSGRSDWYDTIIYLTRPLLVYNYYCIFSFFIVLLLQRMLQWISCMYDIMHMPHLCFNHCGILFQYKGI